MSWFDGAPPPPPEPTPEDWRSYVAHLHGHQPPWMNSPEGVLGGHVSWHIVLADTEDYSLVLSDFVAYATGLRFTLLLRYPPGRLGVSLHGQPPRLLVKGSDRDSPKLGIGFSDGRKVVLGPSPYSWRAGERPVLHAAGEGAGGEGWQRGGLWLWPLPPAGPITFAGNWVSVGVEERTVVADAAELVEAAKHAADGIS